MSIWDDISKAFEDLFDYVKQGVDTVVHAITDASYAVSSAVEQAFRQISDITNTMVDGIKDVGITISQGVIDGATTAYNYVKDNAEKFIEEHMPPKPDLTPEFNRAVSKAVAAVFLKIANDGEEYDVFGPLSMACEEKEKKPDLVQAASNIIANRVGDDLYNMPLVAKTVYSRNGLKDYLAWLVNKAATENPQLMTGGKAGQAVTGLITVAMINLVCEHTKAAGSPPWPPVHEPDPIDTAAPTVWPEGSRVEIDKQVYLVLDGKFRYVPGDHTFNNLFEDRKNIIKAVHGLQVGAEPLTDGAYLAATDGDPKVYLVNDGVKRWISSGQVFKKYNFSFKAVKKVSRAVLDSILTDHSIYQMVKREGAILKIMPEGGLYLLLDKTARHIPNPATFNQLFVNWNNFHEVSAGTIPLGPPLANGAFLATAGTKVYFVNGQEKRWMMSPIAFNNFFFDWNKIRKVSAADLDKIPEGKSIY